MEATVRIRFKRNEKGAITIMSDYADIIENLDCEDRYVCENCGECFQKERRISDD